MKRRSLAFAAALAAAVPAAAFAYEGPVFDVRLWKGETAIVEVPARAGGEMAPFAGAEEGGVRVEALYSLSPVMAAPQPHSFERHVFMDMLRETGADDRAAADYCRVAADASAAPGTRSFGPLRVTVLDRTLPPPPEWRYFLDLWQHPWAVARYFGDEPFSDGHFKDMEREWKTLAECGVKTITVTLLDLPWNHQCLDAYHSMIGRTKTAGGEWKFDYSLFDRYVEFCRECGLGPDIACYTMCPWGYVVRWTGEDGTVRSAAARPGTEAFEDYWGAFLEDFSAHLHEKGWFDDAYIAMDERSPDDVRKIAEFVQARAPGLKIAMAGNRAPSQFEGIVIDNYSQGLNHMTEGFLDEVRERAAKGMKTTYYVCCSPARPNTFLASPAGEAFWLGAYAGVAGFDGFLRWAANSWPADPCEDSTFGNWKAGDAYLVYPEGRYSRRLAELRAGIVAAEKLRILNEAGLRLEEKKELAAKYGWQGAQNGTIDFSAFRRDAEAAVNRD